MPDVRRNAAWLLGCRIGADLLNFVLFVMVSRSFGTHGVGAYAYGFAIAGFMYSATSLGIDEYGIREYVRRSAAERGPLMAELLGAQACVAGVALLALAGYLIATRPTEATLSIILILTLYQLCAAFGATLFVPAMATQRMSEPAVVTLVSRALALIVAGLLIALWRAPLPVALLGFAAAGAVTLGFAVRSAALDVRLRLRLSLETLRASVRTLWSFAAVNVMGQLITRIGIIALALMVSEHAAGVYATGFKLVEAACLPVYFIGLAWYPRLSASFRDMAVFERLCRQALWWGLAIALASGIAMYLLVPPLLAPLFGEGYVGEESVIASMGALAFAMGMEMMLGRLLLAANLSVARAAWLSVGSIVCAAATLAAAPSFGVAGAVVAVVLSHLLVDVLYAVTLFGALHRRTFATPASSPSVQTHG